MQNKNARPKGTDEDAKAYFEKLINTNFDESESKVKIAYLNGKGGNFASRAFAENKYGAHSARTSASTGISP